MNDFLTLQLGDPIEKKGVELVNINMSEPIGSGAQARVYKVKVDQEYFAAKIFHDPSISTMQKIRAMIENPPVTLETTIDGVTYPLIAWPKRLLYESGSGKAIGYLMRLANLQDSFTLDHFYDHNLRKRLSSPEEAALSCRVEIARNLSQVVASLHKQQHYCIDFKPQNIRVYRSVHVVTLIDCDGYSILDNGGKRYPAHLLSTDYIAPEVTNNRLSIDSLGEEQDLYALAVIIFQLLNQGLHPFQGVTSDLLDAPATNDEKAAKRLYPYGIEQHALIKANPQSIHRYFDRKTRDLFDRAFSGLPVRQKVVH